MSDQTVGRIENLGPGEKRPISTYDATFAVTITRERLAVLEAAERWANLSLELRDVARQQDKRWPEIDPHYQRCVEAEEAYERLKAGAG